MFDGGSLLIEDQGARVGLGLFLLLVQVRQVR